MRLKSKVEGGYEGVQRRSDQLTPTCIAGQLPDIKAKESQEFPFPTASHYLRTYDLANTTDDECSTTGLMASITWNNLGPREKEILAILRLASDPQIARQILEEIHRTSRDEIAYTTVNTILGRLTAKGLIERSEESYAGSHRYQYAFHAADWQSQFAADIISEFAFVFGRSGLDTLEKHTTEARQDGSEVQDQPPE